MKRFDDLKFRDHMHHCPLEDSFHKHWGYHLCGIILLSLSGGHTFNMHLYVTLG